MPTSMNTGTTFHGNGTSMRFCGKWDENHEYLNTKEYIDLVESEGSLWICQTTNSGRKPTEGEYWALAAQGVASEVVNQLNEKIEEIQTKLTDVNAVKWQKLFMAGKNAITDCNDLPDFSCAYSYSDNANRPFEGTSFVLTFGCGGGYSIQLAVSTSNTYKHRIRISTGWSSWA